MKRSFWGSFISPLLAVEFDIAQPQGLRICPAFAVETNGKTVGALNRIDGLRGFGDNPTSQNGESARENQGHPPIVQPIDVPVSCRP
jgi:hypothetical protein